MWRSPKALDLLRDPRIVVHSVTCKREGTDGDIKLYGRAVAIDDLDLRTAYRAAIKARINWEPRKAPTTCSPWTSRRAAMSGSRARKRRYGRGTRPEGCARTAARPWWAASSARR
jgi:hypothetical protein